MKALIFITIFLITSCAGHDAVQDQDAAYSAQVVNETWGVDDFIVRLTSSGYMLDIRYRVTDVTKARPLFDRKIHPYIIEEGTGVKYGVPASPKIGFMRQAPKDLKQGKMYILHIANPGRNIKQGSRIALVIGDFMIKGLIVE